MKDPVYPFPVVTEENFPLGLMCPECMRVIKVGQPFQHVFVGIYDNGDRATRIQCVYCD